MADLASLYIKVDSKGVVTASKDLDNLTGKSKGAEKATESVTRSFSKLQAVVVALASSYALLKMAQYIKDAALLAARYETLGVVMRVVGNNAGYTGAQMEKFARGLQKSGIAMVESRNTLARMIQAQIDLTSSQKLARIAQDAAVIGNLNSSEAFEHMIYGLQTGHPRILRTIGLNVDFDASVRALAVSLGIKKDALNEAQIMQGRVNAVMKAGVLIEGAYSSAMETAGKQLLSLTRHFDNLKVLLGAVFTPALAEIIETITGEIKDLNNDLEKNKEEWEKWGNTIRLVVIRAEIELENLLFGIDRVKIGIAAIGLLYAGPGALIGKIPGFEGAGSHFKYFADMMIDATDSTTKHINEINRLAAKYDALVFAMTPAGKLAAKQAEDALEAIRLAAKVAAKAEQEKADAIYKQTDKMKEIYAKYYEALEEMEDHAYIEEIKRERERLKELENYHADRLSIWEEYNEDWQKLTKGETQFRLDEYEKDLNAYLAVEQAKTGMTDAQIKIRKQLMLNAYEESVKKEKEVLSEVQEYWKHTFENIHDATADTFYDIFKDVEDGFQGLIENIKNWFLRLLAEMTAMAIANPIKIIIGTAAGALGLPGIAEAGEGLNGSIGTTITKWINQSPFGETGALTEWGATWGNMLSYAGIAFNTINAINALSEGNYGTAAGTGIGTIAGALLGGPLGAAIGGGIGSFLGGIIDNIFGGSNAGFGSLGGMKKSGKWGEIPSFGDWTQMPRAGGPASTELIEGFEKAIQDTLQGMYDAIGAFSERMPDKIREKFEAALANIELWYLPPLEGLTAVVGEKLTFALTREQAGNLEEYVKSIPTFILDQIAPALQDAISEWAGTFDLTLLTEDNPLKKLYDEILEGVQDGNWETYFEKVDAFMNTMGAVEEIWTSLNETIDNALNPLSKFETALLDVDTQFNYWIDTLEQLGFTVEAIAQIEADRILILQKLIKEEIERQSKERQAIIAEHELTDYQRQIQATEEWRDAQLAAWSELEDYMDSIEYLQGIADILKAFDYLLENIEDRITRTIVKIEDDLNRRLAQLTMSPEEYQKYMVESQYQATIAQLVALEEETGRDLSDLIDLARQLRDVELETLEEQKKALEEQKKAAEAAEAAAERQREYARWDAANALYFKVLAEAADTTEARRSLRAIDDKYQSVIDRFADLGIYLWDYISHVWTEEEKKVFEALNLIRDREIEALRQSILDSQQRLIDMWGDAAQQIEDQINEMKLTSASPEDAQQRMALLRNQIRTMTGGDVAAYIASFETPEEKITAMNKIREMWAEYLSMAQEVYQRPSDEYQHIYDEVLMQLEIMKDIATGYQSQEQLLMDQLIVLTDIRDLIAAFEGLGSYQSGTDYVPKTGLYELHVGEQVIPVKQRNYDGPQVSFAVHITGSNKPKETAREVRKEMESFMISGMGRKLIQNTARGH